MKGAPDETALTQPAFATPPHLTDDSETIAVWFTEPAGAVVQMTRASWGTADVAHWLVGPAWDQLLQRFPREGRFLLVLDLRAMLGRDREARSIVIEKAKAVQPRIERAVYLPPTNATPLYLNSIRVSAALLRVFGVQVDIEQSFTVVRSSFHLQVAK